MKKSDTLKHRNLKTWSLFLFLFCLKINAQCPTIPTSPITICDAAGFTFSDLNVYATDNGNGISWYDSATGGNLQPTNHLVDAGTYFADDNSGTCGTRNQLVINFNISATNANLSYVKCTNDGKTGQDYFDEIISPATPAGLTAQIYSDEALTTPLDLTQLLPNGGTNLYVVFSDGTCTSQVEIGSIGIFASPEDPTPPTPQQFCSDTNPTVGDLVTGTASNSSWYNNPAAMGSPLSLSQPLVNGIYYVRAETFFCDSNPVPVTVEINDPVEAGDSLPADFCQSDLAANSPIDLFDYLNNEDAGGSWNDDNNSGALSGSSVDLTVLTDGTFNFTYTVNGVNACPDDTATVVLTIYPTFTSGTVAATNPAVFCESEAPNNFDLFSLLDNEDTGGQWTEGNTSGGTVTNSPLDLTSLTPGTYNYTYTQNVAPNPCPEESTTVQVEILADPNPGVAINAVFCENDLTPNPFDLFTTLDGSQDNNSGIWTDASNTTVSNPIDISTLTVAGSPYTFTYTINNGTCEDSENITLTVLPAPESGTVSADSPIAFCLGEAPASYDLFDLLDGEDQTGTWFVGTDNTGATVTNPTDLSVLTPGNYSFTFDVDTVGTCDDVLVTVEVIINDLPNTGIPNNPAPFCANDPALNNTAFNLNDILTGEDAGGNWNDDDNSNVLTGNTIDLSALPVGTFNYTYSITDSNSCTNSSTVTITILEAPESGTVSADSPISFCLGEAPASYDLFDLLDGEDQTGTWFAGTDNTGSSVTNPTDLSALTSGNYSFTFDVDAVGTCDDVLVTVEVIINDLPNTGTATPLTVCETTTNTALNLFDQLSGETTGGTWTDDNTSGALTGNTVDLTALPVGTFNFTYSISDSNACSNSTVVSITIEDAPEAGTGTNFEICLIDTNTTTTLDLFNQLTGNDTGGTWADDNTSGALTGNIVDLTALTANTTFNFTYTVTGVGTCLDDTETISVIVNQTNAPTVANATQDFCDSATVSDLSATGNNVQWYDNATLGTALASSTVLIDGETYYASQTDASTNCESSIRTEVIVTIFLSPNAGTGQNQTLCNNVTYDLNGALTGADATGIWADDNASGALTGSTIDTNGLANGDYNFTYTVSGSAPCVNDSETITITIETPVTAGTATDISLCSVDATIDLFDQLTSETAGGQWTLNGTPISSTVDPSIAVSGTYIYTIASACNFDTASVEVTIQPSANAGGDNTVAFCVVDGTVDLLTQLTGTPDTNGTWSPALTSGTNIFDPHTDTTGTYTYTVLTTSPCTVDATATLTITVNNSSAPTTTNGNNLTLCLVNNPTVADLDQAVTGTNVIWYDDATSTTALASTTVLIDGEDYFATQTGGTGNCESSTRTQINVTIGDAPTPTLITGGNSLCINDNPTIATLTNNIVEYNSTTNNVIWYDAATNGTAYNSTAVLEDGETYYAVLIDPITNCESSIRLEVILDLSACGNITIPDGFSPNGDGVNDTFTVDNLEFLYPNYEIEFYNRYGNIVYKTKAGQAEFAGKSNQSGLIDKGQLPVGVYYYILNFNDGKTKTKQGSFYLNR